MSFFADRVRETSTTSGTGTLTLAGAVTGYQSFSAGVGVGSTCFYAIVDGTANTWEVGYGTLLTSSTLARTTVLASSNSGSLVSFAGNSLDVFVTIPAVFVNSIAPTNYLINGGFNFAQRQPPATYTTIAQDKYGPDRWRMCRENADLQHSRIDTAGAAETGITNRFYGAFKKITNTGKILVAQILEANDTFPLVGRTVNFQVKLKASSNHYVNLALVGWSGTSNSLPASLVSVWQSGGTHPTLGSGSLTYLADTPNGTFQATTSWQQCNISGVVSAGTNNLACVIYANGSDWAANDVLYATEAMLCDGTPIRAWLPRPNGDELRLCQRFYTKTFDVDTGPSQNAGIGTNGTLEEVIFIAGASLFAGNWRFPVSMRVAPTLTTYNPGATNAQWRDVSDTVDCTGAGNTNTGQMGTILYGTGNTLSLAQAQARIHATAEAEL